MKPLSLVLLALLFVGCGGSQAVQKSVFDIEPTDRPVYERLISEADSAVRYFTTFDLTRIAYRVILPSDGEIKTIVAFIHGTAAQSKLYLPLADSLRVRGIGAALIDLRGHGLSGGARGDSPSADALVRDVRLFLDTLRRDFPNAKIVLGGHSLGAGLCLKFVDYFAERKKLYRPPDGLLLMSGGFLPSDTCSAEEVQERRKRLLGRAFARIDGAAFAAVLPASILNLRPHPIEVLLPDDSLAQAAARDGLLTVTYSIQFLLAAFPANVAQAYQKLKCPTLLIVGRQDEIARTCDAEHAFKRLSVEPRELFIVGDANHINVIWKSAGAIADWLKETVR